MARYFHNLELAQNRRMRYLLLAYLLSVIVGASIGICFPSITGVIGASLVTYFLSMKLTEFVYKKIKAPCPLCDAQELIENFTLQCRPARFECKECNSIYMKGVLIEK